MEFIRPLAPTCPRRVKAWAAAAALVVLTGSAQAALIKSYDFNGTLDDTLGNGASLVASGGTVGATDYTFGLNQGLRLSSALANTSTYAIEMRLRATDSLADYNKLIDFQDLTSDLGFYIFSGGFEFYTAGLEAGTVALNSDFTVGLARSAGSLSLYLNGALLSTAADGGGQAVPGSNVLNFFEDDNQTGQGEAFAGVVDYIRIHEDVSTFGTAPVIGNVPEPGSLALFALALVGLGLVKRRASRQP